jgi:pilus assembly protein CpaF
LVIEGDTKDLERHIRSTISQIVLENISSSQMTESEGLLLIQEKVYEQGRQDGLTIDACLELSGTIFDEMFKLGILQKYLDDYEVNEIMINGYQNIHIEKNGEMICTNDRFETEEALNSIIQSMVSKINRRVNQSNPIVDARLEDGSRIHIVLNPVAINGPILTIRKFRNEIYTLDQMHTSKMIDSEIYEFLKTIVKFKYNVFISGGTSSGKTTFLNALSHYIPKEERIITIEDSAELSLSHFKNLVRLETKAANSEGEGEINMSHLIKASLRMRPDRIIVGEVRGKEALDMIHAMSTGHDGSLSTGHGNSCRDMLKRLELMILKGVDLPTKVISKLIASSLDIIIQLERGVQGQRFIREVCEVIDEGEGYKLNPLYIREKEGLLKISSIKNREKIMRYEK